MSHANQAVSQASINKTTFNKQLFRIPVKIEQLNVGKLLQCLDQTITLQNQKLKLLKHVKQSLLQKMFIWAKYAIIVKEKRVLLAQDSLTDGPLQRRWQYQNKLVVPNCAKLRGTTFLLAVLVNISQQSNNEQTKSEHQAQRFVYAHDYLTFTIILHGTTSRIQIVTALKTCLLNYIRFHFYKG